MDLYFISKNRDEYIEEFTKLVTPLLIEGFQSIFANVKKSIKHKQFLYSEFQDKLRLVKYWSVPTVEDEYRRIVSTVNNEMMDIEKLIKAIFISCSQVLSCMESASNKVKHDTPINITIPKPHIFIHMCYTQCARKIWKQPFLLYDNGKRKEFLDKLASLETIIKNSIQETIRSQLPFKEILDSYVDAASYEKLSMKNNKELRTTVTECKDEPGDEEDDADIDEEEKVQGIDDVSDAEDTETEVVGIDDASDTDEEVQEPVADTDDKNAYEGEPVVVDGELVVGTDSESDKDEDENKNEEVNEVGTVDASDTYINTHVDEDDTNEEVIAEVAEDTKAVDEDNTNEEVIAEVAEDAKAVDEDNTNEEVIAEVAEDAVTNGIININQISTKGIKIIEVPSQIFGEKQNEQEEITIDDSFDEGESEIEEPISTGVNTVIIPSSDDTPQVIDILPRTHETPVCTPMKTTTLFSKSIQHTERS